MNIIIQGKVKNLLTDEEKKVLIKMLNDRRLTPDEQKIKERMRSFIY